MEAIKENIIVGQKRVLPVSFVEQQCLKKQRVSPLKMKTLESVQDSVLISTSGVATRALSGFAKQLYNGNTTINKFFLKN